MDKRDNDHPKTAASRPCVWAKGGIMEQITCALDYQCDKCAFDQALWKVAEENRRHRKECGRVNAKWGDVFFCRDRLQKLPVGKRPCIHYANGHTDYKACNYDYTCETCEFDQYFKDEHTVYAVTQPVDVMDVKGFKMPQGYYFHEGHTWVKVEADNEVRIGLDEFALRLLGPLDAINMPLVGSQIRQGQADIDLRREGHKARVLSPVSGVVTAINPDLMDKGFLANKDPYAEGWIMRVHSDNLRADIQQLLIGEESRDALDREIDHLFQVIEEVAGPLAADGGVLTDDIYGNVSQIEWERLIRVFLKT